MRDGLWIKGSRKIWPQSDGFPDNSLFLFYSAKFKDFIEN